MGRVTAGRASSRRGEALLSARMNRRAPLRMRASCRGQGAWVVAGQSVGEGEIGGGGCVSGLERWRKRARVGGSPLINVARKGGKGKVGMCNVTASCVHQNLAKVT